MLLKKIVDEQVELNKRWELLRSKGFFHYIIISAVKCFIMLCCIILIDALLEKKLSFDTVLAGAIVSILIPIFSWFGNEIRYKLMNKKK